MRLAFCGILLMATAGCRSSQTGTLHPELVTLRVGVGEAASGSAGGGIRPFVQNLSMEGLIRIAENGRAEPRLARDWTITPNGLMMDLRLKSGVKFHDGSPVTTAAVVKILGSVLPPFMGPVFEDIEHITAIEDDRIQIGFKTASPFLQEALEVQLRKSDQPNIGTGPFRIAESDSLNELRANDEYYLGRPSIDRIVVTNYPSIRAAWADLLRDRIDMLYEVSDDAQDSLTGSKSVSVFSFTRPYQYVIAFNLQSPKLKRPEIRRALNAAIDRASLVRDGLNGRGTPSAGPIWPQHWSLSRTVPQLQFDPSAATRWLGTQRVSFKCLLPSQYERLGLLVKRQLELVGVEMQIEETTPDRVFQVLGTGAFEAVFLDMVSGPSLFRTYEWWHSKGSFNPGSLGSPPIDATLDRIRHAASDDEYRAAVAGFQRAIVDNPPAIFLAWSQRARAVNRRFDVVTEPGRDILTTLRLWRPTNDLQYVGRN